jgi:hypothetical protein
MQIPGQGQEKMKCSTSSREMGKGDDVFFPLSLILIGSSKGCGGPPTLGTLLLQIVVAF